MKSLFALLIFLSLQVVPVSLFAQDIGNSTFDPSYTHVVYFWLENPDNVEDCREFEAAIMELMAKSQYTKTNFLGRPPKATRDVVDDSFTYTMIVTFDSAAAQNAYQEEQVHLDFISRAGHLWKKVVVYDALGLAP